MNGFKALSISISALNGYTFKVEKNTFYFDPDKCSFTTDCSRCWFPAHELQQMKDRLLNKINSSWETFQ